MEEVLAGLWADVLKLERVGVHDNFFAIGGDSILSLRLIANARKQGLRFTLNQLFQYQTIRKLGPLVNTGTALDLPSIKEFDLITAEDRLRIPDGIVDAYPVTRLQAGMLYHSEISPGVYYNLYTRRIRGSVNEEALRATLEELIEQHPVLRSSFEMSSYSEPLQLVHAVIPPPLVVNRLHGTMEERDRQLEEILLRESKKTFDPARVPLFSVRVDYITDDSFQLTMTEHHAILDGWSVASFFTEWFERYWARVGGKEYELSIDGNPFRDYVVLEREALRSSEQEEFWKSRIAEAEFTSLPIQLEGKEATDEIAVDIASEVSFGLQRTARLGGVPLKSILMAAHLRVMSFLAGTKQVLTGMVTHGRPGSDRALGMFLNTVPFKITLEGGTWVGLAQAVARLESELFAYRYYPMAELQKKLDQGDLFESIFNFNYFHIYKEIDGAGQWQLEESRSSTPNNMPFSASFALDGSGEVRLEIRPGRGRFSAVQMEQIAGYYQRALTAAALAPEDPYGSTILFSKAEQEEILVAWNETAASYPRVCAHEAFEEQVNRTPQAMAVWGPAQQFTYAELNQIANGLARLLRSIGVRPEVRVGVCMERSEKMVVALLAVLKAGGAYVPLDPSYPPERLEYMLADAGASVLVTDGKSTLAGLPGNARVVALEDEWDAIRSQDAGNLPGLTSTSNLAYVLYTSGSTGRPKGVTVEHRQIVNYSYALLDRTGLASCSFALVQPLAVDSSLTALYPPLFSGGSVFVVPREWSLDSARMSEFFRAREIGGLKIAPSHLAALHGNDPSESASIMPGTALVIGGEGSRFSWVSNLQNAAPQCTIFNHYGPTETTVGVLTYRLGPGSAATPSGTTPLGKPLPNTRIYVLDENMEPVPIGVAGELYVGGHNIARGYLDRPALTAESFVPDQFYTQSPGGRLYKTGDRARYLGNGNVEFLGRFDHQVKLRGFRIEPAEIETVLLRHPSLLQAVVVIQGKGEQQRLVAYVVPRPGANFDFRELRSEAQKHLPHYMVPTDFVGLQELPRTAHGKLDRKKLPQPETRIEEELYVAPRNELENTLAEIWRKLFGVAKVGIHNNFFELGGDSILSIQMVARARAAGLQFSPRQVFERQTIAELAAVAQAELAIKADQGLISGRVPLGPIQAAFFDWSLVRPDHYNQVVLLRLNENTDSALLESAVAGILHHHDMLRSRYAHTPQGWEQWCEHTVPDVYEQKNLSSLEVPCQQAEMERHAEQIQSSLDLARGRVIRAVEYHLGQEGKRLLLVAHHLVIDGVSWRILLEDLELAYQQLRDGKPIRLGPKTTSFKSWTERLQEYSRSESVYREASYWAALPYDSTRSLPRDFQGGEENTAETQGQVAVTLNQDETRELLQDVPGVYHTQINDVLLTAVALTFAEWSESDTVLIELEGHGRENLFDDIDLSRTAGWFTTIYPVLLSVPSGPPRSGSQALKSIKEQLRQVPNRGFHYGLLRFLANDQDIAKLLNQAPTPEIGFNYLGQLDQSLAHSEIFTSAAESAGRPIACENRRRHLIDVNAIVAQGKLRLTWGYSSKLHRRETIEQIATRFMNSLRDLIEHCRSEQAGGHTPSDFPLANMNQQELDRHLGNDNEVADILALSPMQQGLWFHSLYESTTQIYFNQLSCQIEGNLDVAAFRRAWEDVVSRHDILRTRFLWQGLRHPVQMVQKRATLPWHEEDWRNLSSVEQQSAWKTFLHQDRARGFDLTRAPLMRLTLIRTGESSFHFVKSNHHILLDGWGVHVILGEVFMLYEGYRQGRELQLPPATPYREYIAWLQKQRENEAEQFWCEELKGFTKPTRLPHERGQDGRSRNEQEYATVQTRLQPGLSHQLQELAREEQVTLNTIVQAAWAVLLGRYSLEQDLVFGGTVSGRSVPIPGMDGMVGLFINTLPVRVQLQPDERVGAYLRRLQMQQARTRDFEHSPLVQVQGGSEIPRGTPLFESVVVFENYPVDVAVREAVGASIEIRDVQSFDFNNYPLTLIAVPGAELSFTCSYNSQRFTHEGITRLVNSLTVVLEGMVEGPEKRIGELGLMSRGEREEVIRGWQGAEERYVGGEDVASLFEEQVGRTPGAIAVVDEGKRWSYEELNGRANQIGHYLQRLGVGAEVVVGIGMERRAELVAGLLGILKAGGAYLPLEMEHPGERLKYMVERAGVRVIVTGAEERKKLEAAGVVEGRQVVSLEEEEEQIRRESRGRVKREVSGENAAYVIYTSGSTGKPKGVVNTQKGIRNRLLWMQQEYGLGGEDCVLQKTPYGFDVSVWEFFLGLMVGARVVMARPGGHRESRYLAEVIEQEQVTTVHFVPSMLQAFVQEEGLEDKCRSLRRVISSGEALSVELARRAGGRLGCGVHNLYGPTEAAVDVTSWGCGGKEGESGGEEGVWEPIGRPIANLRLYVLDEEMEAVGVGVEGELYIGGVGVARGYAGGAELTAERFVPNPVGGEGERLYKTGDRGRWHEGGWLEYLGRRDEQVKIRGQRIELGEIEAGLLRQAGVQEAVVVVQEMEGGEGEKRLVGYVVRGAGAAGGVQVLREGLRGELPEYMVPAVIVELEQMPVTGNGKVDRKGLPRPGEEEIRGDQQYVGPATAMEEVLAGLWADVLKLERVGVHDNFFAIGGHSLLAAQVISRVREIFGADLPIRSLFDSPTIASFATHLQALLGQHSQPLPPIQQVPRNTKLPLSYAQQRLWLMHKLEPGSAFYNVPLAFHIHGPLRTRELEQSFRIVAARHETLRTVFSQVDGDPIQIIRPDAEFSFRTVDMQYLPEAKREATALDLARQEPAQPFNLESGPLMRACLFELSSEEHIAVITMHHIITDGWSMTLLIDEVRIAYEALCRNEVPQLPHLGIQFADFAEWERKRFEGKEMQPRVDYWRKQLGGDLPVIHWPERKSASLPDDYRGSQLRDVLSPEIREKLHELGRHEGATLFMTLLAAYQTFLHRLTNCTDLIVGTPADGRYQSSAEKLIGCFINMRLLRVNLADAPTFRELLRRARKVTLDAEANELPFDKIVQAVKPDRSAARTPLYQVTLALHNTPPVEASGLYDLSLSPVRVNTGTSQSDLLVLMMESPRGIETTFMYSTGIFEAASIEKMMADFKNLISRLLEQPDISINKISSFSEAEKEKIRMARHGKFQVLRQNKKDLTRQELVTFEELQPGQRLPLLVRPTMDDVDLTEWAQSNMDRIERELLDRGGILFRGFAVNSVEDFGRFSTSLYSRTMKYQERSTPRTEVAKDIYTSTEYPPEQTIAMHNEFSYGTKWPMKIWFYCNQAAEQGGQTPIADSRKVYAAMDPEIRERFARKKVMYVRNYGSGIDLPWQTVFQTQDRAEVEAYCRNAPIEWQWMDGDRLRTWQVREAIAQHPQTGEMVWFNQAHLFHLSNLERDVQESLLATFGEENLPRQARYGDGTPIEQEALHEVQRAYREATIDFDWQPGDVLLLDNMLIAHGRRPFRGSRRILVAMAEPHSARSLEVAESVNHAS
jgi:amino acid adenylation domain-containing protein/non-ribosomal peptide synthase protein (TIGR01720 family)